MRSTVWNRFVRAGALASAAGLVLASAVSARPVPDGQRSRAINLFASSGLLLEANRVACGIDDVGQVCVAFSGSPVGGGGFWPKGTPNQYIFNSGLQLAAVVDPDAPFPWAGDTAGAWFFDPRGDQASGTPLTPIFNSLDPLDLAAWPNGGVVRDPAIYHNVLLGESRISDGDSWVRYWEGDPTALGGREHPMGIMVEQRSLAWNFPAGNEDIIYFVFTFYNVTASDPAAYDGLDPAIQTEVAAVGAEFQRLNEQKFPGLDIPAGGYTLTDMFAAFGMDADVAVFSHNYSTAFLPFNIGSTYSGDFLPEVGWRFPDAVHGPPFFGGPGFVGVKYLRSPEDITGAEVGLTMFSNTTNGLPFPDAVGDHLLYRRLSGFLGGGDIQCNPFTNPVVARARRLCFLAQVPADARFYQASGPFDLAPGAAATIVVAYIHAAPVDVPGIVVGSEDANPPGIPATGDSIAADPTKVRLIDSVAGWVSHADADGNNVITQNEVTTVPRSLLNKALVAQAVFDAQFLLPNAPAAPPFFLVPGDNQVTITWQRSATETAGDLYFEIASEPFDSLSNPNALYDPNFRQFDVEGYRVYRGRTASELTLIAQFDYSGKTFVDFTGAIHYGDENGDGLVQCAPELGLQADCPVTFDSVPPNLAGFPTELAGEIVQVKAGERVELATGSVLNLIADTAVTGGGSGFPPLRNTGMPFAFVDTDVRNSFTYHYVVTGFDVNSVKSGPSSLESPKATKTVTPRKPASNQAQAELVAGFFGDDGVALDPTTPFTIDPATGRFNQTPPPTNALVGAFAPLVPQLLPSLSLEARIDSLTVRTDGDGGCPVSNGLGACYLIYVTFDQDGVVQQFVLNEPWPVWTAFDGVTNIRTSLGAVAIPADETAAARFGIPAGFSEFNATVEVVLREYIRFSSFEGQAARRGLNAGGDNAGYSPGGSRWFDGTTETIAHPGLGIRVGHLAGADTVWAPIHHTDTDPTTPGAQTYATSGELQCFGYGFAGLMRQADVAFTWGSSGTLASVRDVTHHVDVSFKPTYQSSYGFVGDFNANGYIDFRDFNYVDIASQFFNNGGPLDFCNHVDPGPGARAALVAQPVMLPVSVEAAPTAGTGTGFGLYVNGERYIVRLAGGTPPADGTVWTLRSYAGTVRASDATIQGASPSGYSYSPTDRPPIIPGLTVSFEVAAPTVLEPETAAVLDGVHTVPDPYYVTNALETTANEKVLKFVGLPARAIIRIYSLSGVLVNVLSHDDAGLGGEITWNLRNRNNQFVASGVYFYHVETPAGNTKVGRFTVVNFAP